MTAAGTWGLKFLSIMPVLMGAVWGLWVVKWVGKMGEFWLYVLFVFWLLLGLVVGPSGRKA